MIWSVLTVIECELIRDDMEKIFIKSQKQLDAALKRLRNEPALGFDTETSGLDSHVGKVWSIQIGTPELQVLIPLNGQPRRFNLDWLMDIFLDKNIVKIAHNAAFDIKVVWSLGLDIHNVWCTRVGEQLLNAGLFGNNGLAATLERYFGVKLSKEERKDFYCDVDGKSCEENGTRSVFDVSGCKWTPELIDYALDDIGHLVPLMQAQYARIDEEGMIPLVTQIEMPLVKVTAAIEYRGVKIDRAKCKAYQEEMATHSILAKTKLIYGDKNAENESDEQKGLDTYWKQYAVPVYEENYRIWEDWKKVWEQAKKDFNSREGRKLTEEAKAKREEYKLKQPFKTPPKAPEDLNLNSSNQLLRAFEQAGVYLKNTRKETIQDAAGESPLLDLLIEYKKYYKLSQMSEIYEKINRVTQRIHQVLNQNVDTGRFSSSGPNLTNIPARSDEGARFRSLFVAEKGNLLIGADYSAIELVIIGIRSKDKVLLEALSKDLDLHCWTMSKFLNCDYEALVALKEGKQTPAQQYTVVQARMRFEKSFNLPELKKCSGEKDGMQKWVKTFRDYCKTLTYGIAYGLSAFGLSRRFHCDAEEAQRFIDVFFQVYSGIKRWLDRQADFAEDNGYSKTASGRRRYYKRPFMPKHKDISDEVSKLLKQQGRDVESLSPKEKNSIWEQTSKRLWREYHQTMNRIRRQASNHPVQGGSADITKLAMVLFEYWWIPFCVANGVDWRKFGLVLTVHDELVVECPKKFVATAKAKLKECMETAAKEFLGYAANIVVTPSETEFWKK